MTSFAALAGGGHPPLEDDARAGIATGHVRLLARLN
jgi:hypothetical protein